MSDPRWWEVRVGDRHGTGQVNTRLVSYAGATGMQVQVVQMASATVEISLVDAVALHAGLGRLLRAAGANLPADGNP